MSFPNAFGDSTLKTKKQKMRVTIRVTNPRNESAMNLIYLFIFKTKKQKNKIRNSVTQTVVFVKGLSRRLIDVSRCGTTMSRVSRAFTLLINKNYLLLMNSIYRG